MNLTQYREALRRAVQSPNPTVRALALTALEAANKEHDTLDRILIEFLLEENND